MPNVTLPPTESTHSSSGHDTAWLAQDRGSATAEGTSAIVRAVAGRRGGPQEPVAPGAVIVAIAFKDEAGAHDIEAVLRIFAGVGATLAGWTGTELAVILPERPPLSMRSGSLGVAIAATSSAPSLGPDVPAWVTAVEAAMSLKGLRLGFGVAYGNAEPSSVATAWGPLSTGPSVARALGHAAAARVGEVWLDPIVAEAHDTRGRLRILGRRHRLVRGREIPAVRVPACAPIVRGGDSFGPLPDNAPSSATYASRLVPATLVADRPSSADRAVSNAAPPAATGRVSGGLAAVRGTRPTFVRAERGAVARVTFRGLLPDALRIPRGGALSVVRADPGTGGSFALVELALLRAPICRTVLLRGVGLGLEAFGSLRSTIEGVAELATAEAQIAATSLREGRGVSLNAAASLLTVLAGASGAFHLDDVATIDSATLAAVARASLTRGHAVVVRVDSTERLAPELAALPLVYEWHVPPLADADRLALVRELCPRVFDGGLQRRLARSRVSVLGQWILTRCFVDHGRLLADVELEALARGHLSEAAPGERALLAAIGWAPGILTEADLPLLASRLDVPVPSDAVARWLKSQLVERSSSGRLRPFSSTHAEAMRALVHGAEQRAALEATAHVVEERLPGLGGAHAAGLFAEAGEGERAASVALRVTERIQELGLDAVPLLALARRNDANVEAAVVAGIKSSIPPRPASTRPPLASLSVGYEAVLASLSARPADDAGRSLFAHPTTQPPDTDGSGARTTQAPVPDGGFSISSSTVDALRAATHVSLPSHEVYAERAPTSRPSALQQLSTGAFHLASKLSGLLHAAMLAADPVEIERWLEAAAASSVPIARVAELRGVGLSVRGHHGDALSALRHGPLKSSEPQLQAADAPEQARHHVALSFALARAGRLDEALYSALEALALAQRAPDAEAERAAFALCASVYGLRGEAALARRFCDRVFAEI